MGDLGEVTGPPTPFSPLVGGESCCPPTLVPSSLLFLERALHILSCGSLLEVMKGALESPHDALQQLHLPALPQPKLQVKPNNKLPCLTCCRRPLLGLGAVFTDTLLLLLHANQRSHADSATRAGERRRAAAAPSSSPSASSVAPALYPPPHTRGLFSTIFLTALATHTFSLGFSVACARRCRRPALGWRQAHRPSWPPLLSWSPSQPPETQRLLLASSC